MLFQPSMIGLDQCGLVDVIEAVLSAYPSDIQERLMKVLYVKHNNWEHCNFDLTCMMIV